MAAYSKNGSDPMVRTVFAMLKYFFCLYLLRDLLTKLRYDSFFKP